MRGAASETLRQLANIQARMRDAELLPLEQQTKVLYAQVQIEQRLVSAFRDLDHVARCCEAASRLVGYYKRMLQAHDMMTESEVRALLLQSEPLAVELADMA